MDSHNFRWTKLNGQVLSRSESHLARKDTNLWFTLQTWSLKKLCFGIIIHCKFLLLPITEFKTSPQHSSLATTQCFLWWTSQSPNLPCILTWHSRLQLASTTLKQVDCVNSPSSSRLCSRCARHSLSRVFSRSPRTANSTYSWVLYVTL